MGNTPVIFNSVKEAKDHGHRLIISHYVEYCSGGGSDHQVYQDEQRSNGQSVRKICCLNCPHPTLGYEGGR